MPKAALKAAPYTLGELMARGERAYAQATEAIRALRVATQESEDLRLLVDRLHHGKKRAG